MKLVPAPLAVALLLIPLAGCSDDNGGPQLLTVTVTVADHSYSPLTVTIPVGSTVNWNWTGVEQHDLVWSASNGPAPAPLQPTGTYQRVFDTTGTFGYFCSVHIGEGMTGTIIVQ